MEDAGGDAGDADDEGGETDLAALAAEAATDGHRNDAAYAVKQASNVPGGETGRMRVNRDYDFDAAVPGVDPDGYVQQHQELDKWRAEVAGAIDPATSHKAGISVSGPTQIGKTLAAKCLAAEASAPFYRLQCTDGMEDADIRGDVSYVDDETWFNDSDVVQALISSQVRPTVLLIDEANRTPPQAKSALFPVLADECSVQIPGRNETVSGDPENLIVISTMNEGSEYVTYDFDFAEIPRFGRKHELTHLGMADASAETALMKRETGIAESVAMEMVDAANTIRQEAADQDFSSMDIGGVPTGVMIEWASTAQQYAGHIDDAVHEAAIDSVVTPFYPPGQGVEAHDFAMNVLSSLKGVAYENADEAGDADDMEDAGDDAENAGDADESEDAVTCLECEYRESVNDAPAAIAATLQCPECDGDVTFVDGDDSEGIGDLFS
jgi:MoxR-like ATPase